MATNIINFLYQNFKTISHISICERTGFYKQQIMLASKVLCSSRWDRSLIGVPLANIQLIANEHQDNVWLCVLFDFTYPFLNIFEWLLLSYIINEQSAKTLSVMCWCYGFESLLSSCNTPNMFEIRTYLYPKFRLLRYRPFSKALASLQILHQL